MTDPKLVTLTERTLADGYLFHDAKGRPREMPLALAPLADTHGHLTGFRYTDPSVALARAALAGVRLLVVSIDPALDLGRRWKTAAELLAWLDACVDEARDRLDDVARHGFAPPEFDGLGAGFAPLEQVRIVAGVHPYGAVEYLDGLNADGVSVRRELEALLDSPRCVGVGEFGLDDGPYNETDLGEQERAFRRHLAIAHERDLPCELHIRSDTDEGGSAMHDLALRVLGEVGVPRKGCDLHCFTMNREVMEKFLELGCHIAFGGAATFKNSGDIRRAAHACPRDRILSETDSPYMAPAPMRGRDCEPAMVGFTVARLAEVRGVVAVDEGRGPIPHEQTYRDLWDNAVGFFGL